MRADPLLEPDELTYGAAINCFRPCVSDNPVVRLSSIVDCDDSLSEMFSTWTPNAPVDEDNVKGKPRKTEEGEDSWDGG